MGRIMVENKEKIEIHLPLVDVSDIKIDDSNAGGIKKNITELKHGTAHKEIRTIKVKQDIYYGPKNSNKNKFVRIYKKLGLVWIEGEKIEDTLVDGWFNKDRSQYIIKLPEEGGYKRFKFYGCDDIYDYFISLGGITFELLDKDNIAGPNNQKSGSEEDDEDYRFIGADLSSHYRFEKMLKKLPLNWGVIWK